MAGIVNSVQPAPAPAAPQPQAAQSAPAAAQPAGNQSMYDNVAVCALKLMFDVHRFPIILAMLAKNRADPVGSMGRTAAMIMMSIQNTAKQQGKMVPTNILFQVLREIASNLVEIAMGAGIVKKEQAKQLVLAIGKAAVQIYQQNPMSQGPSQDQMQQRAQQQPQQPPAAQPPAAPQPAPQGQPMMGA